VGPRTGLDACGKTRPPPGFGSPTVQPVASRYTDCAVPADCHTFCSVNFQLMAAFFVQVSLIKSGGFMVGCRCFRFPFTVMKGRRVLL
jgi:hypothetical protein